MRPGRKPQGKPPTEEQRQRLMRNSGALAALTQHPSWPDLVAVVDEKEEKLRARIIVPMFGSPLPVNQREVDYVNGFIHGMRWFLEVPANAESRLESYLKEYAQPEGAAT